MDTTAKSFASGDFLVDLTLRNDSLTIVAENQLNWRVFSTNLNETAIRNRISCICLNPRDLFYALADAFTGAFPEITVSISHNGELNYCSRSKVGSQQRKNQFSIQLEEQRGETSIKNEKHFVELQNKLREHEREICKLGIALQQSEKKRLEESNKFHLMIETLVKKIDVLEQNQNFLLGRAGATNGPAAKINPAPKTQAVNTNPLLASKLPIKNTQNTFLFGRQQLETQGSFRRNTNPFQPQPNLFDKNAAAGKQTAYQGQTKQVTAFNNTYTPFTSIRGSLTPAPNASKNNFLFWNVEPVAASNLPNNTQSLFKLDPNNKLGKKLLGPQQTVSNAGGLFSPSKDPKNLLTPELQNSQTKSPGIYLQSPQLTGHDSLDSAGNPLPQDSAISRNFSFQNDREIEEKKEEDSVSKSSPLKKMPTFSPDLVKITIDEIERQEKNQEEVNDIILDTINFEVFTEEIAAALEKHKDTLLFLSLNDCALSSLRNLPLLPKIVRLEITDNFLKPQDLITIAKMKEIQSLSLGGNYINNYEDLEPLKGLPKLVQLDLVGSSICFQQDYHKKIFSMLEHLEILDNRDVDGNEIDYDAPSENGDEQPDNKAEGKLEAPAEVKDQEKK